MSTSVKKRTHVDIPFNFISSFSRPRQIIHMSDFDSISNENSPIYNPYYNPIPPVLNSSIINYTITYNENRGNSYHSQPLRNEINQENNESLVKGSKRELTRTTHNTNNKGQSMNENLNNYNDDKLPVPDSNDRIAEEIFHQIQKSKTPAELGAFVMRIVEIYKKIILKRMIKMKFLDYNMDNDLINQNKRLWFLEKENKMLKNVNQIIIKHHNVFLIRKMTKN